MVTSVTPQAGGVPSKIDDLPVGADTGLPGEAKLVVW